MTEVVSRGFGVSPWPSKCCRTTASMAIPWDWTSRDWQSGAFRKLLIPAKVKSSQGFPAHLQTRGSVFISKEPVTKPPSPPSPHQRAERKKWVRFLVSCTHATNPSLIYNFLFLFWCSQGSLMCPVLPYWSRGCTKYKLLQVNPKTALVFSPLDFKVCPVLPASPHCSCGDSAVVTDWAAWVVLHRQALSQTEINHIPSQGVRQTGERKIELINAPWPSQTPTWGKSTMYKYSCLCRAEISNRMSSSNTALGFSFIATVPRCERPCGLSWVMGRSQKWKKEDFTSATHTLTFLAFCIHYHSSLCIFLGVGQWGLFIDFLMLGQIQSVSSKAPHPTTLLQNTNLRQVRFCPHRNAKGISFGLLQRADISLWVFPPTLGTPLLWKKEKIIKVRTAFQQDKELADKRH